MGGHLTTLSILLHFGHFLFICSFSDGLCEGAGRRGIGHLSVRLSLSSLLTTRTDGTYPTSLPTSPHSPCISCGLLHHKCTLVYVAPFLIDILHTVHSLLSNVASFLTFGGSVLCSLHWGMCVNHLCFSLL